uniref:START domain-containing protein n=1 Tax=Aegilops tauschii subsp. strangulata TaxID=200361 RepID=A0A453A864_AEGTS
QAPAQPSLTQATAADHLAVVPRAKAASSVAPVEEELAVSTPDLMHLRRVVEEKDGGPAWTHMMDRTLPTFRYQAWKREPQNGPPQYRSSTIFEDASPDVVRDFFWDDDFRISNTWDDMLLEHETLEECAKTGTMVVRWVRKSSHSSAATGSMLSVAGYGHLERPTTVLPRACLAPLFQGAANLAVWTCTTLAGASVQLNQETVMVQ